MHFKKKFQQSKEMENLGFVASEDLKRSEIMQKALLLSLGGVHKILAFFDHLPPSVDIFYLMNIDIN